MPLISKCNIGQMLITPVLSRSIQTNPTQATSFLKQQQMKLFQTVNHASVLRCVMGSRGFLLEPILAISGRWQGTPWTSRQLIAGPLLMAEAAHQEQFEQFSWLLLLKDMGYEPATNRSLADLLYPVSYSRLLLL